MPYHEALAKIIRQELARKLPPEVFEDQVVEKKMLMPPSLQPRMRI